MRKLATGGMAEVFLARLEWARGLTKPVVVKRILYHLAEDPGFLEMFCAEAQLAAQLNHPNIAQIIEFAESAGVYFLAMEYVDGPSLRALAASARAAGTEIPCAYSARIASFCCEALIYAHELTDAASGKPLNLVHRDVTPDNILVSKVGAVKLVDFGIAKAALMAQQKTKTGLVKGKLGYMSPEQLRGEPVDRRADIYSLGMVLYELVTGAKPYDATSEITLVHSMLYEEMIPPRIRRADVPPELERIINRALERDREKRYPDCRSMHADLEEYLVSSQQAVSALQLGQFVSKFWPPPAAASEPARPEPTSAGEAAARLRALLKTGPEEEVPPESAEPSPLPAPEAPEPLPPPKDQPLPSLASELVRWDIFEEHLDEADFLSCQWEATFRSPDYTLTEIAAGPERRLLTHLDALVLGGPPVAEKLLRPALGHREPGVVFAAAFALLDGARQAGLDAVVAALENAKPAQRAAIRRALAVVPRVDLGQRLAALASASPAPAIQVDLLEVLGQLRFDPGLALEPLLSAGKSSSEVHALRLAQVFPDRLDPAAIERAFGSPVPEVCSAAFETGLVLGVRGAFAACESAVSSRTPGFGTAALLLGLSGDDASTATLLQALEAEPELRRDVVFALGFSGRIAAIDPLMEAMEDEELAPLAAEAFSAITGLRVEKEFAISPPRWSPDDADDDSGDLVDEVGLNLPEPDPDEFARWWKDARPRFDSSLSQRWLRGQRWSFEALLRELEQGPARRREALALDVAIRTRGRVQLAWNALTSRQRQELLEALVAQGRPHLGPYRDLRPAPARGPPAPSPVVPRVPVRRTAPVPSSALAITGIGMVTSLGWGVVPVCAALRAGLVRPAPLDYTVLDPDDASATSAVGHPVEAFEGYEGLALHAKMAAAAIEDLLGPRTGASPPPLEDLALLCALSPTRAEENGDVLDELLEEDLGSMVAARLPVPPVETRVVLRGHTAGLSALSLAADTLRSRRAERVLVVATDRLVGRDELAWLDGREMLKTPENPAGLAPGQAAVAVLVETQAAARKRRADALGFVEMVAMGTRKEGQPPGRALAHALLRACPANMPVGDLYGDLNGETARANEWGSALVHLAPRRPLDSSALHLPALGLGDTGAASGLIAVSLALHDFARGWSRGERAIVWSQSDAGEVAAALVTPPEGASTGRG